MKRQAILVTTAALAATLGGCAVDPITIGGWRAIPWGIPITPFAVATLLAILFYLATLLTDPALDPGRLIRPFGKWMAIALTSLYALGWILLPTSIHNFRVTVDVAVDGVTHSGSSVIEVSYSPGWLRWLLKPSPYGTGGWSEVRGVAPIVDLGKYGTLFASMGDAMPNSRTGTGQWRAGMGPQYATYKLYMVFEAGDVSVDLGPRVIPPDRYPQFIWVPPDNDPEEAIPLLSEEFGAHISRAVSLVEMRISPTTEQAVDIVEPEPIWLARMRVPVGPKGYRIVRKAANDFVLHRRLIETGRRD